MSSGLEEVVPAHVLSGTRSLGVVAGGRVDVYRSLALAFGTGVASTDTHLWVELNAPSTHLYLMAAPS